jgi:cysteine synthase
MDFMEEVGSFVSYEKSLELCRNGLLVGPSSGLALVGLLNFLKKHKDLGRLDTLRNESGEIPCTSSFFDFLAHTDATMRAGVFICCDQPFQYISEYFTKLGPSYFRPIINEELFVTDLYPYEPI